MYHFRNDYSYGAHPKVMEAIAATNFEGLQGYGDDPYSQQAKATIRTLCNAPEALVEFMIGGTQTNFVAIAALLRPWEAVICATTGHVNDHEGGAVESTGHKLLFAPSGVDGKVTPDMIPPIMEDFESPHVVLPKLLYISDATENGAVYTKAELTALSRMCKQYDLYLFVDGARLGCALASEASDVTLADLAALTDVFYIGGTKNGALLGEALVFPNPRLVPGFFRFKKQRGAVLAKGWIEGVEFETLLKDGLYFDMAKHANAMAKRLQDGLRAKGYTFLLDSPTNQIFPIVSDKLKQELAKIAVFEDWCPAARPGHTVIRFVTCFHTQQSDVDGLLAALPSL